MAFQELTGIEYLKVDVANNFGLDKEDWDVRLDWFDQNEHQLHDLIRKAEEPALYFAGVRAYEKAMAGEPSGYPISLDATSSGIQFLSVLTGDRKAAMLCNVIDTGHRADAYTGLYGSMLERIGEGAKITRAQTKEAIMTAFYNSTAVPKRIFGEGALLDAFYDTMKEEAPGAWELNETMLAIWDEEALVNSWVLPDNFHVRVKVMGMVEDSVNFLNQPFDVSYAANMPISGGRSLGANMTHSLDGMAIREIVARCMHDPVKIAGIRRMLTKKGYHKSDAQMVEAARMVETLWEHYKDSGFVSFRIFDYLDSHNMGIIDDVNPLIELLDSIPAKPFQVLTVHDCFRVLPNYGNDIRRQYNRVLMEIGRSNMLSFLISQIVGKKVEVQKLDPNMWEEIMDANYALS